MFDDARYIVIEGHSSDDSPIRPHNWAERFAGNLASYGPDLRLRFSDEMTPLMKNGVKCLRMERSVLEQHPSLANSVLGFAEMYKLKVHGLEAELAIAS